MPDHAAPHRPTSPPPEPVQTGRTIFLFWAPLAAQWMMMAVEGPFLAAIIARMEDATYNLAAFGVAFAIAILVEAPVIMLMSAATALVEGSESYRRLRNFANALNAGSTALLVLLLVPPVYDVAVSRLLGLPQEVTTILYGALWILLPWPAAIGYRRFLHGVLIRSGRTRRVAYGTVLRLGAMAATAAALYLYGGIPGAWVGAAALSAGVCVEAVVARFMAAGAVRELRAAGGEAGAPGYRQISSFYFPLILTSVIGLTVHPLLTFLMGRAPQPVESLAVFPVVHGLSFLFRAPGFAFQEVVIALSGRRLQHVRTLAAFGGVLAVASAMGLATVVFTPLASVWFGTVSGLTPELAAFAATPARILAPLPILAVAIAFQHALLVKGRRTRAVTVGTAVEVTGIILLFTLVGWRWGMVGASAASLALLGGRLAAAIYLTRPVRRVLAHAGG